MVNPLLHLREVACIVFAQGADQTDGDSHGDDAQAEHRFPDTPHAPHELKKHHLKEQQQVSHGKHEQKQEQILKVLKERLRVVAAEGTE